VLEGSSFESKDERRLFYKIFPWWYKTTMRRSKLLQFLKIRRALPKPPKKFCDQAVTKWVSENTSPRPSMPVPLGFRRKAEKVLSKRPLPTYRPGDVLSPGSCIGATRRQGGRTSLVPTLLSGLKRDVFKPSDWDAPLMLGRLPYRSFQAPRARIDEAIGKLKCPPKVNLVPLAVPELGWKCRIVTRSDPAILAKAECQRRRYYPVLTNNRNTVTSSPLGDPEMSLIGFHPMAASERAEVFVYSADFTKATDLLTKEVLDFLCTLLEIPPGLVHEGLFIEDVPLSGGTPMGMPVGWTLLSFTNFVCALQVDHMMRFRIKGDDLIALWTLRQIMSFRHIAAQVGLIVNDKSATSKTHGTFCEADYRLEWRHGGNPVLVRLATFSLRAYVSNMPPSTTTLETVLSRGVKRDTLLRLEKQFFGQWREAAKYYKVPLVGPRQFGCLGFLGDSDDLPLDDATCCLVRALNNGVELFNPITESSPYATKVASVINSIPWCCDTTRTDYVDDYLSGIIDEWGGFYVSLGAFTDALYGKAKKSKAPTLWTEVRTLARYRKRALKRAPPPFPTTLEQSKKLLSLSRQLDGSARRIFGWVIAALAPPQPETSGNP